jgi:hypothetical protein
MNRGLDTSKASFKLDLIETANADPMVTPADFKVLSAYAALMKWPSCKSWLATTMAMAMTGLSDRQFEKSKARLLGKNEERRAYLTPIMHGGKVATFMLINPWRDEARVRVDAMLAYHREVARQKKATIRASLSPNTIRGQEVACPRTQFGSVPELSSVNTPLLITPKEKKVRGEDARGSNVVPFNIERRSAS